MQMSEIALLILDECHHCKKRHPANEIMQQFWHPAPASTRPHIFGMTASLVDSKLGSKDSMQSLVAALEANLGAKVWMGSANAAKLLLVADSCDKHGYCHLLNNLIDISWSSSWL